MHTQLVEKHDVFTAWEYILMDIASQYNLDKLTFPKRLEWAYEHFNAFESLAEQRGHWKEHPLFMKAVMTLRRIQAGQPTGAMIGLDATCSGMAILSVLIGCETGARSTGMIDPTVRADAYTACTKAMQRRIPGLADGDRESIKDACMTTLYGSKAIPEALFGEATPELQAFYQSLFEIAPGACQLITTFRSAWQRYALSHNWVLPDNHHVEIPVMTPVETSIEIDELGHTCFKYEYSINKGTKKGLSLIANITHSVDAYVLRSLIRRCNYDPGVVIPALYAIQGELLQRLSTGEPAKQTLCNVFKTYVNRFEACGIADISLIPHLDEHNVNALSTEHLRALSVTLNQMRTHEPFPIVCIHDEFKTYPDTMNHLRMHYKEIMAQIAESNLLNDLVSQITGKPSRIKKLSTTLGDKIRLSNYSLC